MKRILLYPCLLLLLSVMQAGRADYPIEVIQLKSRPLEEILPVIRPLIGADGTATGMGNTLVLKAAPHEVREIRQLLGEIDRPPRRLLITVSKQGERLRDTSGYSAGADIRAGDGQISINTPGHPVDETRARLHIHDSSGQRTRALGQHVQALEGRPAFIASGTRIPLQGVERYMRNGRLVERRVTGMHEASSGFYVLPRVSGEYVTLEIHQRDDRARMHGGTIATQSADTVVRGRLGEWISLGGIDTAGQVSQAGPGHSHTASGSVTQQIEVMVECLDCTSKVEEYRPFLPQMRVFE